MDQAKLSSTSHEAGDSLSHETIDINAHFDRAVIDQLMDDLDADEVVEILLASLEETEEICAALPPLVAAGDVQGTRKLAHKLKGCASGTGAFALAALAAQLETAADAGVVDKDVLNDLLHAFDGLKAAALGLTAQM